MFQQTLNELRVELAIRPIGPILIKEGRHQEKREDDTGQEYKQRIYFHRGVTRMPKQPRKPERGTNNYANPDDCFNMAFVHSRTPRGDRFYIPGSSLRGVLRSTAERVVGRWRPDLLTDPFARYGERFAGSDILLQKMQETHSQPDLDSIMIYRKARPLERCFGNTLLRGRWVIADAWMQSDTQANVIVRDGVGINRHTGAAENHVKYQFEAVTGGVFTTTLTLVNYELWQLGLLAHVLATLDGGMVRIGYGTRRGLGRVSVCVTALTWRWYQRSVNIPPVDLEHGVTILPLATLATLADLPRANEYHWCDAALTLTLPLQYQSGALVPEWVSVLHVGDQMDWNIEPWPTLGTLLPTALRPDCWPAHVEVVS